MRKRLERIVGVGLIALAITTPAFPQGFRPGGVPVKLQVVITRGEGEKKVREPYSLVASSSGEVTSLRKGYEVPVSMAGPDGKPRFTFQQIGTQIDSTITAIAGEERYKVQITITKREAKSSVADAPQGAPPTFFSFIFAGTLILRNGETAPIVATDLVSNETWQADVTVSLDK